MRLSVVSGDQRPMWPSLSFWEEYDKRIVSQANNHTSVWICYCTCLQVIQQIHTCSRRQEKQNQSPTTWRTKNNFEIEELINQLKRIELTPKQERKNVIRKPQKWTFYQIDGEPSKIMKDKEKKIRDPFSTNDTFVHFFFRYIVCSQHKSGCSPIDNTSYSTFLAYVCISTFQFELGLCYVQLGTNSRPSWV